MSADLLPPGSITQRIVVLRRQKVLLDADLAALYGVPTKRLNEQVKRNIERFHPTSCSCSPPPRKRRWSQIATTSPGREGTTESFIQRRPALWECRICLGSSLYAIIVESQVASTLERIGKPAAKGKKPPRERAKA